MKAYFCPLLTQKMAIKAHISFAVDFNRLSKKLKLDKSI